MLKNCIYTGLILALLASGLFAAEKRAMTVEDMWAMQRLGDVQLSPDGKKVVFTVTKYNMETNKGNTDLWLAASDGGRPVQLTSSESAESHPRWSPDGRKLAFISDRDGSSQIYYLPTDGGEAYKAVALPMDVDGVEWSPMGKDLIFTAEVYPDLSFKESAEKIEKNNAKKVKAKLIDRLMYRPWNRWKVDVYSHLFTVPANGGDVVAITSGAFDCPPIDLGGGQDYRFSPDGKHIAYVANLDPMVTTSTNNDVFLVPFIGGPAQNISADNKAVDNQPVFSPDGKFLAYRAMARPGFEADQYDLILYELATGAKVNLTRDFDRDVDEVVWAPDSKKLFFTAGDEGRSRIYSVSARGGACQLLYKDHYNTNLIVDPSGKFLYFLQQRVNMPNELFRLSVDGKNLQQLTRFNADLLSELDLNPLEDFWFTSFDGRKVHGLMVKPPFFDANKKYPMVYLIHGGPQGMWDDLFHYRWNASMFAAPGYVVVMVNFRGSKGYGQEFCDQVSNDWGGGPYRDLMVGVDYALQTFAFLDPSQVVAAGASYGGYMINWIAVQDGASKFKCLVSHSGVFELYSKYGATDELWFPEWEFGGDPYQHPEQYQKWSPSTYAKNLRVPTLVIHGQNDFRVSVDQGFQMFTALQRQGVPSKLLYFPDEYHFVTKPQNARLWWSTVFQWFDEWLKK